MRSSFHETSTMTCNLSKRNGPCAHYAQGFRFSSDFFGAEEVTLSRNDAHIQCIRRIELKNETEIRSFFKPKERKRERKREGAKRERERGMKEREREKGGSCELYAPKLSVLYYCQSEAEKKKAVIERGAISIECSFGGKKIAEKERAKPSNHQPSSHADIFFLSFSFLFLSFFFSFALGHFCA